MLQFVGLFEPFGGEKPDERGLDDLKAGWLDSVASNSSWEQLRIYNVAGLEITEHLISCEPPVPEVV